MNLLKWFIYLTFGCLACSESSTTPSPSEPVIEGPYKVTSLLNDSTWFGSAYASKTLDVIGQSTCTSNRFDIGFSTDLPYYNHPSTRPVTGCLGDCIRTQMLEFHNVPLAIGKYEVTTLNSCAGQYGAINYYQLVGGDVIINKYNSQNSKIGWIEITAYNANQKAVEGSFEVELVNQAAEVVHFKKGTFKARTE